MLLGVCTGENRYLSDDFTGVKESLGAAFAYFETTADERLGDDPSPPRLMVIILTKQ